MKNDGAQLAQFLVESGMVTAQDLQEAQQQSGERWEDYLIEEGKIEDKKLRKANAYVMGIPFVDLENLVIEESVLRIIPEAIARKNNIVAFAKEGNEIKVAMLDPGDLSVIDFIRKKTESKIVPCITSKESMERVLRQYQKSLRAEFGEIIADSSKTVLARTQEGANLEKIATDLPVIKIVSTLIKHAIIQLASDIHIEPTEDKVVVRYRIDGILNDIMNLPIEVLPFIVARIKVLSNLKLDEHRLPQDGRFKIKEEDLDVSFRVSIFPVYGGEKVVMRILNESVKGLTLEQVGLFGEALEKVHAGLHKSYGMILISGPTGSGKTTTLYTMIDLLNSREVNICTIEDPIEYRIPGINQTQVNFKIGLTFAQGLRSLLRQDPDIILVGEIRDKETAEIAAHASMTGHLVFSTIHTNSAAGAFTRLIDIGIEPFLVASTVTLVAAQRLVRRICTNCVEGYYLNTEQVETLRKSMNVDLMMKNLEARGALPKELVGKKLEEIEFKRGAGCDRCLKSGFKGRIGIFEVLDVDDEIAKMITEEKNAREIDQKAQEKGMLTMAEDGLLKAMLGITTVEEMLRVVSD